MIGPLEGPGTITIRATGETQLTRRRQLFVLARTEVTGRSRSTWASSCRSSQEGAAPTSSESVARIRRRSASACGRPHDAAPAVTLIYLPVQGPSR